MQEIAETKEKIYFINTLDMKEECGVSKDFVVPYRLGFKLRDYYTPSNLS